MVRKRSWPAVSHCDRQREGSNSQDMRLQQQAEERRVLAAAGMQHAAPLQRMLMPPTAGSWPRLPCHASAALAAAAYNLQLDDLAVQLHRPDFLQRGQAVAEVGCQHARQPVAARKSIRTLPLPPHGCPPGSPPPRAHSQSRRQWWRCSSPCMCRPARSAACRVWVGQQQAGRPSAQRGRRKRAHGRQAAAHREPQQQARLAHSRVSDQ